jgi:hypothetical protein
MRGGEMYEHRVRGLAIVQAWQVCRAAQNMSKWCWKVCRMRLVHIWQHWRHVDNMYHRGGGIQLCIGAYEACWVICSQHASFEQWCLCLRLQARRKCHCSGVYFQIDRVCCDHMEEETMSWHESCSVIKFRARHLDLECFDAILIGSTLWFSRQRYTHNILIYTYLLSE